MTRGAESMVLPLVLALLGCGGGSIVRVSSDGGPEASGADGGDAGVRRDAGPADDAGLDAGPRDAGQPDSGHADVGEDGGRDAGAADGGRDAGAVCIGRTGPGGDFHRTLTSGGQARTYVLHAPPQVDAGAALPLIIALHGFTEDADEMSFVTHLNELADQRGFVVAYGDGISNSWNGGSCCGAAQLQGIDDVGFTRDLIDSLSAEYCVDVKHVHVTGFSNGGFLAHRIGCELADRVASIGVVAGQLTISPCTPSRPISVFMAHGTADPVVPYLGNIFLGFPATAATMGGWAQRDGCQTTPRTFLSSTDWSCDEWPSCDGGVEVQLCTVTGGVHDWFGGGTAWDAGTGFNATRSVVRFFEQNPMP